MQQHKFNIIRKSCEFAGKTLTVETGRLAKQANGAIFISMGETRLLVTATMSSEVKEGQDFFPLTVDFVEKMYATGKIPGGFFKRETKPSTDATLLSRIIDRSIRPLFPDGFLNTVHVVVNALSYDEKCDLATLGLVGASLALSISDIPFNGPIAGVNVGLFGEEIEVNPCVSRMGESLLDLSLAGSSTSIVMIEAGAKEIGEDKMTQAVYEGHEVIKTLCRFQADFIAEAGKEKSEYVAYLIPEEIRTEIKETYGDAIKAAFGVEGKLARQEAIDAVEEKFLNDLKEKLSPEEMAAKKIFYKTAFHDSMGEEMRQLVLSQRKRVDGRELDEIRPISIELDILPRVHGSALFTRGETQSLGTVTLGTADDEQIIDGMGEEYKKRYFLHYNFPPFSVGEAGNLRAPGRRELGHGALAERALLPVMPNAEKFPYTIRIVSDILESNGSSSMASVCAGCLSMMAAGVPISAPVAGIANGLIKEGDSYAVLTDIAGMEDHLGDMDFKVTGTRKGITAMQMDIKISGITQEIMITALAKAKAARHYLLDLMQEVIAEPRKEMSEYAPRIETMNISQSKISEVIGSGGKTIKGIIEQTKVSINIDDAGVITIASPDRTAIEKAKTLIKDIVEEPERDGIYPGIVARLEPFGAFVRFMGNKMGLVHVSQMAEARVNKPEDLVKLGDTVNIKFMGMKEGKYQLTMKGVAGNPVLPEGYKAERPERTERPDRGDRPDRRGGDRRDSRGSSHGDRHSRGEGHHDRDRNRN